MRSELTDNEFSGECSNRDYSRSLRKRMRRGAMKPE